MMTVLSTDPQMCAKSNAWDGKTVPADGLFEIAHCSTKFHVSCPKWLCGRWSWKCCHFTFISGCKFGLCQKQRRNLLWKLHSHWTLIGNGISHSNVAMRSDRKRYRWREMATSKRTRILWESLNSAEEFFGWVARLHGRQNSKLASEHADGSNGEQTKKSSELFDVPKNWHKWFRITMKTIWTHKNCFVTKSTGRTNGQIFSKCG